MVRQLSSRSLKMVRVKSFIGSNHQDIEKQVNEWLESNKHEVIDVNISTKPDYYWALVVYKPQ